MQNLDQVVNQSFMLTTQTLKTPQLQPVNISYDVVNQVEGYKIYSSQTINFVRNANPEYLEKLSTFESSHPKFVNMAKLLYLAGTDKTLRNLVINGIQSGLSNGTMDIIYRIGVDGNVDQILDNFEIANGSLQRRIIISDLLAKTIKQYNANRIVSVAGGSCLLPLEGAFQSQKEPIEIVTIDNSKKANKRAIKNLEEFNKPYNRNISIKCIHGDIFHQSELFQDMNNSHEKKSNPIIIECTGLWEYLEKEDKKKLLISISKGIKEKDLFILTTLSHNPQAEVFQRIGFKKLNQTSIAEMIDFIQPYFKSIHNIFSTPNQTYSTFILGL